jgi:hypothetical protein
MEPRGLNWSETVQEGSETVLWGVSAVKNLLPPAALAGLTAGTGTWFFSNFSCSAAERGFAPRSNMMLDSPEAEL